MRLFIAIDLPEPVKDQLQGLRMSLSGASWTRREALHLTLQFLGDGIPDSRLDDIQQALHTVDASAFSLCLSGVGQFPGGRKPARILWAGVDAPPALAELVAQVHRAMNAIGFPPDARPFSPHITLARLRTPAPPAALKAFFAHNAPFETTPFPVTGITLYASQLTPAGPLYTAHAHQPLRAE
jgi:2'-5' RNA ligase